MPTTPTPVVGVLGCPGAPSRAPALHGAAISALGLDAVYLAFRVEPNRLSDAVAGMRGLGIRGLNATIPHKEALPVLCDALDESARSAGGVNTLTNENGRIVGSSTDGTGFVRSLAEAEVALKRKNVLLAGSGGSARAILGALVSEGVASVRLAARNPVSREELRRLVINGGAECICLALEHGPLRDALRESDMLVNTTPLGMWPEVGGCLPIAAADLREDLVVVDIVPNPEETELLRRAREAGCRVVNGVGMLVHQGAASFELWTGMTPPTDVMRAACTEALKRRREEGA